MADWAKNAWDVLSENPPNVTYVYKHVAIRDGERMTLAFSDQIINVDHEPPMIHFIVQISPKRWNPDHPLWER